MYNRWLHTADSRFCNDWIDEFRSGSKDWDVIAYRFTSHWQTYSWISSLHSSVHVDSSVSKANTSNTCTEGMGIVLALVSVIGLVKKTISKSKRVFMCLRMNGLYIYICKKDYASHGTSSTVITTLHAWRRTADYWNNVQHVCGLSLSLLDRTMCIEHSHRWHRFLPRRHDTITPPWPPTTGSRSQNSREWLKKRYWSMVTNTKTFWLLYNLKKLHCIWPFHF